MAIATGTAILVAGGLGMVGSLIGTGMALNAQKESRKQSMEMLKMFNQQNTAKKQQLMQFMNQSGMGQYASLV